MLDSEAGLNEADLRQGIGAAVTELGSGGAGSEAGGGQSQAETNPATEVEKLKQALEQLRAENTQLTNTVDGLEQLVRQRNTQVEGLTDTINDLRAEIEELRQQLREVRVGDQAETIRRLTDQVEDLQEQLAQRGEADQVEGEQIAPEDRAFAPDHPRRQEQQPLPDDLQWIQNWQEGEVIHPSTVRGLVNRLEAGNVNWPQLPEGLRRYLRGMYQTRAGRAGREWVTPDMLRAWATRRRERRGEERAEGRQPWWRRALERIRGAFNLKERFRRGEEARDEALGGLERTLVEDLPDRYRNREDAWLQRQMERWERHFHQGRYGLRGNQIAALLLHDRIGSRLPEMYRRALEQAGWELQDIIDVKKWRWEKHLRENGRKLGPLNLSVINYKTFSILESFALGSVAIDARGRPTVFQQRNLEGNILEKAKVRIGELLRLEKRRRDGAWYFGYGGFALAGLTGGLVSPALLAAGNAGMALSSWKLREAGEQYQNKQEVFDALIENPETSKFKRLNARVARFCARQSSQNVLNTVNSFSRGASRGAVLSGIARGIDAWLSYKEPVLAASDSHIAKEMGVEPSGGGEAASAPSGASQLPKEPGAPVHPTHSVSHELPTSSGQAPVAVPESGAQIGQLEFGRLNIANPDTGGTFWGAFDKALQGQGVTEEWTRNILNDFIKDVLQEQKVLPEHGVPSGVSTPNVVDLGRHLGSQHLEAIDKIMNTTSASDYWENVRPQIIHLGQPNA